MLPSTPHATATTKLISPLAARYPAGGMTSSLGSGNIDDSTAMRTTMPGYPIPRNRSSSHWMNESSIEAVLSQQGDEPSRAQRGAAHLRNGPRPHPLDQRERLCAGLAQRYQQAAVRCELLHEGRRDLRATGGDQNRIVGRVGAPPERPVSQQYRTVHGAGLAQRPLGREGERLYSLDREDRARESREQRRLIAGAGPDFEHALPAGEPKRLEIAGLRERLRDGLAVADRQRRVLVSAMPHRRRHEQMPRRLGERLEDGEVADPFGAQRLDQPRTVSGVGIPRPRQSAGIHFRTTSIKRKLVQSMWSAVTE